MWHDVMLVVVSILLGACGGWIARVVVWKHRPELHQAIGEKRCVRCQRRVPPNTLRQADGRLLCGVCKAHGQ